MRKVQLLLLSLLFCFIFTGCFLPVDVEPTLFDHKDEILRKGDFTILADRRIFATMAFLNATGFDKEIQGMQMHPVRQAVRAKLKEKAAEHPKKFQEWNRYFQKTRCAPFHYKDFALSLTADYPFKRIRPHTEFGYWFAAYKLSKFSIILNDFWQTNDLDKIWADVKPRYLEEIRKYNFDKMEQQLEFLWNYLRMERTDQFIFVVIPNLLDMHWSGTWSTYENYGYIVENRQVYNLNLHEYLHSVINPLIENNYGRQRRKLNKYYQADKNLPYAQSYQHPTAYTWECFVRALDIRLYVLQENNPETTKRCEDRVTYLSKEGLGLVHPFYLLLKEYEQTDSSLNQFIPIILEKLPEYPG